MTATFILWPSCVVFVLCLHWWRLNGDKVKHWFRMRTLTKKNCSGRLVKGCCLCDDPTCKNRFPTPDRPCVGRLSEESERPYFPWTPAHDAEVREFREAGRG